MQSSKQDKVPVFIISTQKPTDDSVRIMKMSEDGFMKVPPGMSSKVLEAVTGGGRVWMHSAKNELRTNGVDEAGNHKDEMKLAQENIKGDGKGWLIITGHGNEGTETLGGAYVMHGKNSEPAKVIDIERKAEDFVEVALQSNALKAGDTINIALYVCYGAAPLNNHPSFAEQLALAFARYGINTNIVASMQPVGRVGGLPDLQDGDRYGERLKFRAAKEDLRKFTCKAYARSVSVSAPNDDFYFSRNGVGFSKELALKSMQTNERTSQHEQAEMPIEFANILTNPIDKQNFKNLTEAESNKLVWQREEGFFVIRPSSVPGKLTTLQKINGELIKYQITPKMENGVVSFALSINGIITTKPTIHELLEAYRLKYFLNKEDQQRFIAEDNKDVVDNQVKSQPEGYYVIRPSRRNRDDLVLVINQNGQAITHRILIHNNDGRMSYTLRDPKGETDLMTKSSINELVQAQYPNINKEEQAPIEPTVTVTQAPTPQPRQKAKKTFIPKKTKVINPAEAVANEAARFEGLNKKDAATVRNPNWIVPNFSPMLNHADLLGIKNWTRYGNNIGVVSQEKHLKLVQENNTLLAQAQTGKIIKKEDETKIIKLSDAIMDFQQACKSSSGVVYTLQVELYKKIQDPNIDQARSSTINDYLSLCETYRKMVDVYYDQSQGKFVIGIIMDQGRYYLSDAEITRTFDQLRELAAQLTDIAAAENIELKNPADRPFQSLKQELDTAETALKKVSVARKDNWSTYYNSTQFKGENISGMEGPSRDDREHIARFYRNLKNAGINAVIAAGKSNDNNPARGFFDVKLLAYRQALPSGMSYGEDGFVEVANGIKVKAEVINNTPGCEQYEIIIKDEATPLSVFKVKELTLSNWEDFSGGDKSLTVDFFNAFKSFYEENKDNHIGVHCSAGLGRTGTLIGTMMLLKDYDNYFKNGEPNIDAIDKMIIDKIRSERPGSLQTQEQYTMMLTLTRLMHEQLNYRSAPDVTENYIKQVMLEMKAAGQAPQLKSTTGILQSLNITAEKPIVAAAPVSPRIPTPQVSSPTLEKIILNKIGNSIAQHPDVKKSDPIRKIDFQNNSFSKTLYELNKTGKLYIFMKVLDERIASTRIPQEKDMLMRFYKQALSLSIENILNEGKSGKIYNAIFSKQLGTDEQVANEHFTDKRSFKAEAIMDLALKIRNNDTLKLNDVLDEVATIIIKSKEAGRLGHSTIANKFKEMVEKVGGPQAVTTLDDKIAEIKDQASPTRRMR